MHLDTLRPWDTRVPLHGQQTLKPVKDSEDLINKVIACFNRLDPEFGNGLQRMKALNHFDMEPRLNKIKGVAYNVNLPETGLPFILQNNNNTDNDVMILIHEGGHATHSILAAKLQYSFFREAPLEICEVASKAMELMSMDYWDIFYPNTHDLKHAKKDKLEQIFFQLAFYALGESFQLWLYENPRHSIEERHNKWRELSLLYTTGPIDFTGFENFREIAYQSNVVVFTMPLYMPAYCFSELGSLALWRNYKKDPALALKQYKNALSQGNKLKLPQLYEAAGIKFSSSSGYLNELMDFLQKEITELI